MNVNSLLTRKRSLILAYDHGLEHGPKDFTLGSADPESILDIALEGDYNGIILHNGIAEKYYRGSFKDLPLIVKLNGNTNLNQINPVSRQICSVERAMKLGAKAVAYTIYDGTPAAPEMFQEFGAIVEKAHDYGLPVLLQMSAKGREIHEQTDTDVLAYSSRLGLELGADFVTVKYNKDEQGFKWVSQCAGKCKVLISGGERIDDREVLETVSRVITSGATGMLVGRNVWQHPKPFSMTKALKDIIFKNKSVDDAMTNLL